MSFFGKPHFQEYLSTPSTTTLVQSFIVVREIHTKKALEEEAPLKQRQSILTASRQTEVATKETLHFIRLRAELLIRYQGSLEKVKRKL